jgi:hypothetical protein
VRPLSRPLKRAQLVLRSDFPRLEAVGYGSYDGFAAERFGSDASSA